MDLIQEIRSRGVYPNTARSRIGELEVIRREIKKK
jgi:hypothetical protein